MSDIHLKLATALQTTIPAYFSDIQQTCDFIKMDGRFVNLSLPFVCNSLLGVDGEFKPLLDSFAIEHNIDITLSYNIPSIKGQNPKVIKNVIAVASGKGGVGKSTTSINLAAALSLEGATVGILDADIYGPSLPTIMGTKNQQPTSPDNKNMSPITVNDIQTMSIGYLVDEDSATVWRGPMASKAFKQLYNETLWDELDYLIVDMPPGTGDIQLTLAQSMPLTAAVIVTTPQDLALADAIKGIAMFNQVDINVLGIVENMSYHVCNQCGHHSPIFGADGGQRIAQKYQTELLAQLPLNMQIRELADSGHQFMYSEQASPDIQQIYRSLAHKLSYALSQQKKDDQQIAVSTVS